MGRTCACRWPQASLPADIVLVADPRRIHVLEPGMLLLSIFAGQVLDIVPISFPEPDVFMRRALDRANATTLLDGLRLSRGWLSSRDAICSDWLLRHLAKRAPSTDAGIPFSGPHRISCRDNRNDELPVMLLVCRRPAGGAGPVLTCHLREVPDYHKPKIGLTQCPRRYCTPTCVSRFWPGRSPEIVRVRPEPACR